MNQDPKKVPLLLGRDKILAENKQILKEQQNAVEPELKIRINRSIILDFSAGFIKSIHKHKEKLVELSQSESYKTESISVKNPTKILEKQRGIRRRF